MAIIHKLQQSVTFYAYRAIIPLFLSADPKTPGSGSAGNAPARHNKKTQDVPHRQMWFLLYIVFTPSPVIGLFPPTKGRCGYSLTVLHFRKVVIRQKVGSAGKGSPVI
ncbi:hypothetical protein SG79_15830 [Enterobacter hormaechei subsp. xiangfangensis]|nr:hypothetical protein SG79_15830 [Enterobacter hormaechei subsp. xiangfangensis]